MFHRTGLRTGALLATIAAASGIAYAAVGPRLGPARVSAIQAGAARAQVAAATPKEIANEVLLELKTRDHALLDSQITKTLNSKAGQKALITSELNALASVQGEEKLEQLLTTELQAQNVEQTLKNVMTAQGFLQSSQLQANVTSQLQQPATTSLLTQTLQLQNYVQGPAKIITGQATATSGTAVTVLTVPGLLHVEGIWWPSDGTVQFEIFNDSGSTLDFGGDFSRFMYGDSFSALGQQIGTLQSPNPQGSIAPGDSEDFQITPAQDAVDTPSQQVPYQAEAHVQVTLPGSMLATLDLSAYEISQGVPIGTGGSALLSGEAVVGPA